MRLQGCAHRRTYPSSGNGNSRPIVKTLLNLLFLAPLACILEYLQPRGNFERLLHVLGHPGPLPCQERPFRMGHQGKMPAVGSAHCSNSGRRSVWIEGIAFRYFTVVIYVPHRSKVFGQNFPVYLIIREVSSAFAMGHPYTECRAFHTFQHQRRAFDNSYRSKTRFKSARPVLNEPRLAFIRQALPGYPPEQRSKLASVAYT